MEEPEEKRYASDGCLVVSELSRCPFFSRDASFAGSCDFEDCYFCKFSDFRKRDYIELVENEARKGILYSVCHNENNKKVISKI